MSRCLAVLLLIQLSVTAANAYETVPGRLTGAWIPPQTGPIVGGRIYAFNVNSGPPPQRGRSLRLPDAISATNDQGKFTLELAEGSYYLSIRKQSDKDAPGPPQEGDLYGLSFDDNAKPIEYTVKSGKTTDLGVLRRATVYKARTIEIPKGVTAITGVVKNIDGSPLANKRILVYENPELSGKPVFASHTTGKDGKYIVQVDQEGTYFISARSENSSGRPIAGEIIGIYGGEKARPVTVKKQNVTSGIDIQTGQFIDNRPTTRI